MARYDKFDSLVSGPRALLEYDTDDDNHGIAVDTIVPVSINYDGHAEPASDATVVGVVIVTRKMWAGDVVDIMDLGEIVEVDTDVAGAGDRVYVGADGALTTDADDGGDPAVANTAIGYMIEDGRLRVRV